MIQHAQAQFLRDTPGATPRCEGPGTADSTPETGPRISCICSRIFTVRHLLQIRRSQAARGQLAQSKPRVQEGGRPRAGRGGESCGSRESTLVPSTCLLIRDMKWARPTELRDMIEPELGTAQLSGSVWHGRSTRLGITRAIILRLSSILGGID